MLNDCYTVLNDAATELNDLLTELNDVHTEKNDVCTISILSSGFSVLWTTYIQKTSNLLYFRIVSLIFYRKKLFFYRWKTGFLWFFFQRILDVIGILLYERRMYSKYSVLWTTHIQNCYGCMNDISTKSY